MRASARYALLRRTRSDSSNRRSLVALAGSEQELRTQRRLPAHDVNPVGDAKECGVLGWDRRIEHVQANVPHGADDGPARLERRIVGNLGPSRDCAHVRSRPHAGKMSAHDVCHNDHRIVAASAPRDHATVRFLAVRQPRPYRIEKAARRSHDVEAHRSIETPMLFAHGANALHAGALLRFSTSCTKRCKAQSALPRASTNSHPIRMPGAAALRGDTFWTRRSTRKSASTSRSNST